MIQHPAASTLDVPLLRALQIVRSERSNTPGHVRTFRSERVCVTRLPPPPPHHCSRRVDHNVSIRQTGVGRFREGTD